MNHGDDDWLTDDVCLLNLDVMVDELIIIMRCSIIWFYKIYALNMIFEYYVAYVYDDVCLCFNF